MLGMGRRIGGMLRQGGWGCSRGVGKEKKRNTDTVRIVDVPQGLGRRGRGILRQ